MHSTSWFLQSNGTAPANQPVRCSPTRVAGTRPELGHCQHPTQACNDVATAMANRMDHELWIVNSTANTHPTCSHGLTLTGNLSCGNLLHALASSTPANLAKQSSKRKHTTLWATPTKLALKQHACSRQQCMCCIHQSCWCFNQPTQLVCKRSSTLNQQASKQASKQRHPSKQ
jgi:hypothetical protein